MAEGDQKCKKPYTNKDKWIVSIISGILFLIIASPFLFSVVNDMVGIFGIKTANNGCPTIGGLILHSIVFILIVRAIMM